MAKSITKSVGKSGGVNLQGDVKVVQALLNNVPQSSGGPPMGLAVDGVCGPKTSDAIQKFQLRQFGMSGADGRVDPNGRTLAKLNEFEPAAAPPVPQPFPPLTTTSILMCQHGGSVRCMPTGPLPSGPLAGGVPLKPTDPNVVAGCTLPTPCVRVQWVGGTSQTLDARSIGVCLSAASVPQGSVIIAKA